MNWYYATDNEQKGPVDQTEFDRLIQQGTISPTTLVWREGMAEWQPCGEIAPLPASSSAEPAGGGVVCSQCGRAFRPDEMIRLGPGFVCAGCKPIAMQKLREGVAGADSERIRQDHIKHEASVKSVGFLYFLSATFLILGGSIGLAGVGDGAILMAIFFLGLAGVQIWVGLGLRRLKPWARIPTGILSGIGLLGFPLGTLINGYILYLIFSEKGKTVFSADYQRVIQETPHIRYKTSIIVWILLGLLLLLISFAFVGFFFARSR